MLAPDQGDALIGTVLGTNLMEATARLLGIAAVAAVVFGLVFWIV